MFSILQITVLDLYQFLAIFLKQNSTCVFPSFSPTVQKWYGVYIHVHTWVYPLYILLMFLWSVCRCRRMDSGCVCVCGWGYGCVCTCVCKSPWPCSGCSSRRGAGGIGAFISPLSGCRKSNARWESSWQQFSSDRSAALLQFMTKEFTTRQSQSQYRDKYSPSTRSCPLLYQAFGLTVITPVVNPLTRGEEKGRKGTLLQVCAQDLWTQVD